MASVPSGAASNTQRAPTLFDSTGYKSYVLGVLVLAYIFNTIDRGVVGIVAPLMRQELGLSDTQLGLLGGPAFAFFYAFMGIPIARLADRWSRVNVLALAVALWSAATAACGAALGFLSLLFARFFVAVGEAGGSPSSHSIISDLFSIRQRATALSIYAMAVPFGAALSNVSLGWFSQFFGWRATFFVIGVPGIAIAVLVKLTVREPPRGYADGPSAQPRPEAPPITEVLRFLMRKKSFVHMSIAAALHSIVWYTGRQWDFEFFHRSHELSQGQTGNYLGAFALIGTLGTLAGGYLADKLSRDKEDTRWLMWVPGIACAIMVPIQFVAYMHPSLSLVVPAFVGMVILASMFFGPSFTVAQSLATVRMRAVSTSLLLFVQTLIGYGLGPVIVGAISDLLAPGLAPTIQPDPDDPLVGNDSLRIAIVAIGLCNLWAAFHYFVGARSIREDLEDTGRLNAAAA
jgi:MFS family permease